jgi:diguanylate cyclase (GGDEF)-like protein/PAS domain S-box-containing protein
MNSRDIIRSLMTNSDAIIYFKTSDGKFTLVNQKWVERYGVEPHNIVGREHFAGYSAEIAASERKEELMVETSGQVCTQEEHCVVNDGLRHYLTTRFPVRDGDGEMIGSGCIATEITDRKRLQQDLERSRSELQEALLHDQLTGACSRHSFYERAQVEIMRHRRYHHPVVFLLLHVDHLKQLNKRYGYQLGDQTLTLVVERIRTILRDTDVVCRIGGGEFAVIASETDVAGGELLAMRLLDAIRFEPFPVVQLVTVSIGVSSVIEGDDLDLVMQRVGEAALQARTEGGNRVVAEDL